MFAGESGNDPTAFGGKNLIDLLSKRVVDQPD